MRPDWKIARLGEVCKIYQPKTISKKEMIENGKYPVFGANGIIGYFDQYNHEESELLITCRGATCGTVNVSTPKAWITGNAMVVRPIGRDLDQSFLAYLFRGGIDLSRTITGAAQPQITRQSLAPLQIWFPPLAEQRRIVGILDEAFAGIARAVAATEKNFANARELFERQLNTVFAQKGEGWTEGLLSNVVAIKHGFAFKSEYFVERGNYVLLTPGNFFESGGYRDRGDKQKFYEGEIPNGYVLKKGDLLMAMTEQAAGLLGSSIIVPENDTFLHNQRLGLLAPYAGTPWHNRFFFHQFNTRPFRQAAHDSASGVKVRHTSPAKLGQIHVAYPSKVDDQKQIADELDDLAIETQRLESLYRRKLAALAELKQALLQKAFAGELTDGPEAGDRRREEGAA